MSGVLTKLATCLGNVLGALLFVTPTAYATPSPETGPVEGGTTVTFSAPFSEQSTRIATGVFLRLQSIPTATRMLGAPTSKGSSATAQLMTAVHL